MITNFFRIKDLKHDDDAVDKILAALHLEIPYILPLECFRFDLRKYIQNFKDEIIVVVEDYYIDKVYRNFYSNFLSTKLNRYNNKCVRLTFLAPDTDLNTIVDGSIDEKRLNDCYWGFMVLRPISPGMVGRTAVSTKALLHCDEIVTCSAPIRSSICGLKISVNAFPHSSQDSEYCTCAETSIWSVMEYFGNKYPEYSPILPSKIHELLDNQSFERHIPSHGLKYSDISYVLKSLGFGCKVYSLADSKRHLPGFSEEDFYSIFSCYVESGIPMVAAISGNNLGHAIVCVGEEDIDRDRIESAPDHSFCHSGKKYKLWTDVKRKYVFNDDNVNAYSLSDYSCPTPQYADKNPFISSIIVPLYSKLYLDAPRAISKSISLCDNICLDVSDNSIFRTFLASGRTYRDFLMRDEILPKEFKEYILQNVSLPKFVWVSEIASKESFLNKEVDGIVLLDATEPMKYVICHPLLAIYEHNFNFFCCASSSFKKNVLTLRFKCASFNNLK